MQHSSCTHWVFASYLSDGVASLPCVPQKDVQAADIRKAHLDPKDID